jgi:hypothetical protein
MNETYHIGYYYHFPRNKEIEYELIIGYVDGWYRCFLVGRGGLSGNYRNLLSNYYTYDFPVVFTIGDNNIVRKAYFLNDLPICENIADEKTNIFISSGRTNEFPFLYINREKVVDNKSYSPLERRFIRLFVEQTYLSRSLQLINKKNEEIAEKCKDKHRIALKKHIEYVLNLNIEEVVSSLSINVWDIHRNKIGGDDTYTVYKTVELSDKSLYIDGYLNYYLGLGEKCIIEERGFTSHFPHPEIRFGLYDETQLKIEREKLINGYSKVNHLFWLMYRPREPQIIGQTQVSGFIQRIDKINKILTEEYFNLKTIKIPETFLYDLNSPFEDPQKILGLLNEYINREQGNYAPINVIFSGYIEKNDEAKSFKKIGNLIERMTKSRNPTVITGNADGAEHLALEYCMKNKIKYVNGYTNWTMLGNDRKNERYDEMTDDVDLIILLGNESHYLYSNFEKVGKEKHIKIYKLNIDD